MCAQKTVLLLRHIFNNGLKLAPKTTVSEWADTYRMLPQESAEPGRWRTDRAPYQRSIMDAFTDKGVHRVVVKSCSQVGKALDVDTPIPTPEGWKRIVDLRKGDKVFDETGSQCSVLWRSEIMENHDCFEVKFSDGSTVIADADHKWYVEPNRRKPCVLTTRELLKDYKSGSYNTYAVPVAKPLQMQTKELLIHPYLLGFWLGDGNSYSAQLTVQAKDIEIAGYIEAEGYNVIVRNVKDKPNVKNVQVDPLVSSHICRRGHDTSVTGLTKDGRCAECHRQISLHNKWKGVKDIPVDSVVDDKLTLRSKLAQLNLIGNKHIPAVYLRSDVKQRFELLQGLMDSDGSITKKGRCEITLKSKILIDGVSELLHSLGIKHTVKAKIAICSNSPTKARSQVWRISFLVYEDTPVFKLKRQLERQKAREGCRTTETERRRIVAITPVTSRPVCCIAVDSPNHLYLAGKAMIPTHNSDIMNNVIGRFAQLDPCTMMMIQPTLSDGEDFSKSRITPMIEATKSLKSIFRENKSRNTSNTIMSKYFTGGRLIIAGANAPSGLASKPIRILLCDEVDRFPDSAGVEGDPVDLAAKRTTTYFNRVIGLFSTPTIKGTSRIDDEYMTGTQEEWQHQCPNCGEYHLLTHRQMLADFDSSEEHNKKHVVVRSVKWICPDCGFEFSENDMRNAAQKYVAQNPAAFATDTRSFFVNCWTSPWISWNDVMKEWLEAEGDPEREKVIYNTRFGESYERKGNFESEDIFIKRREDYGAELPQGVLLLTAAVDTQDNRLEYEVAGWGHGEERWGIRKGVILGVPDTPEVWEQLDRILDKTYKFANGRGLKIARTFIDCGGHYTDYVYAYCFKNRFRQRFAIKGSNMANEDLVAKIGKKQMRNSSIPLVFIGTDTGKQQIMDRLSIEVQGAKYMHFPLDDKRRMKKFVEALQGLVKTDAKSLSSDAVIESYLNRGYDRIYFRGLISEELVPRKKNGVVVFQWTNIAKDKRNEPLDLAVYNLACMRSIAPNFEKLDAMLAQSNNGEAGGATAPAPAAKPQKRYGCIKRGRRTE